MPTAPAPSKKAKIQQPSSSKKRSQRPDTREALNMRVRPEVRRLIDHAAELTGKNRTDFVLDAARQAAHSALLDRTLIPLPAKAYKAFLTLLDAPPRPSRNLRRSLQTPPPWDR
jgi:uncharacterized protein (DUF1778 family)